MRRGHATRLPKPPYADSRRHPGVNASIFARAPRGNRRPELSAILSLCLWRPAGRSQSCLHTPIRTPVSLHRNLPAEVLRRPIESAWVARSSRAMTACARAVICPSGGLLTGLSSLISDFPKNISVPTYPKSDLELFASHPTGGAYHDRHGRGEGCGGRGSVLRAT